jgi:hypothetical protein
MSSGGISSGHERLGVTVDVRVDADDSEPGILYSQRDLYSAILARW